MINFYYPLYRCTGAIGTEECQTIPKSPIITPPVITSRISTIENFNFQYGRVEVRAKLPSGDWIFPQIFLEPSNSFYEKKNLRSGQMRVAFTSGIRGRLSGGVLLGDQSPFRLIKMCQYGDNIDWNSDFHVFVLEWSPSNYAIKKKIFFPKITDAL